MGALGQRSKTTGIVFQRTLAKACKVKAARPLCEKAFTGFVCEQYVKPSIFCVISIEVGGHEKNPENKTHLVQARTKFESVVMRKFRWCPLQQNKMDISVVLLQGCGFLAHAKHFLKDEEKKIQEKVKRRFGCCMVCDFGCRNTAFRWRQAHSESEAPPAWALDDVFVGEACPALCNGRGACVQGKCICDPHSTGKSFHFLRNSKIRGCPPD